MSHALLYRAVSALLSYPEAALQEAIPEIQQVLGTYAATLEPLLQSLADSELISLQERYVQTFDRSPQHSLHLFEHIHGEDRARGQAMVNLLEEYQTHGFEPLSGELPDYIPLFLEFLSLCNDDISQSLLGDAVHVLAHIGATLEESQSPYAGVMAALVAFSPVAPEALITPPIRDMDEALETFGPGIDGVEPLLKPGMSAPIHWHRQHSTSALPRCS